MSEASEIEREQEAPTMREPATGPLLPGWLRMLLYAIFVPLGGFAVVFIGRSVYVQGKLSAGVRTVIGGLEEMVDLSAPEGRQALEPLQKRPLQGFLYLNQELLHDEVDDPRMARVLVLRKAMEWGKNSTRLDVIRRIAANMSDEGALEAEFLDDDTKSILAEMVEERRAAPERTYAEDRITDVLDWLARGCPERPIGPEKRRMQALERQYSKKAFVGPEADALEMLIEEWRQDDDALVRETAARFADMLEGRKSELSAEAAALCARRADQWEGLFRDGMVRTASVGYQLLEQAVSDAAFIDHPYIYQYVSLLGDRFDEVREQIVAGCWLLRHNRFTIRFLSEYATKTAINPVMAVETVRLTKEEHERKMRRENERRVREAVRLLGRAGADYVANTADYHLKVTDQHGFMRGFIVHALQEVADEEIVSDVAAEALEAIRQADLKRPDGPLFFGAAAAE